MKVREEFRQTVTHIQGSGGECWGLGITRKEESWGSKVEVRFSITE